MKIKKKIMEIKSQPDNVKDPNQFRDKLSFLYWWDMLKIWWSGKLRLMLINMELRSGRHYTFTIPVSDDGFKFQDARYIYDDDAKYYNINFNMWCLDYHQDIALPLKRKIPVNEIRNELDKEQTVEVEYSINPVTLERYVTSNLAEGIMNSAIPIAKADADTYKDMIFQKGGPMGLPGKESNTDLASAQKWLATSDTCSDDASKTGTGLPSIRPFTRNNSDTAPSVSTTRNAPSRLRCATVGGVRRSVSRCAAKSRRRTF